MPDFLNKFADSTDEDGKLAFTNSRSGLIVALVRSHTNIAIIMWLTKLVAVHWNLAGCSDRCTNFR